MIKIPKKRENNNEDDIMWKVLRRDNNVKMELRLKLLFFLFPCQLTFQFSHSRRSCINLSFFHSFFSSSSPTLISFRPFACSHSNADLIFKTIGAQVRLGEFSLNEEDRNKVCGSSYYNENNSFVLKSGRGVLSGRKKATSIPFR